MKKSVVISLVMISGFLTACSNPPPATPRNQGTTPRTAADVNNLPNEEEKKRTSGGSTFIPVNGARPYTGTVTSTSTTSTNSSGITSSSRGGFGATASSHAGGGAT